MVLVVVISVVVIKVLLKQYCSTLLLQGETSSFWTPEKKEMILLVLWGLHSPPVRIQMSVWRLKEILTQITQVILEFFISPDPRATRLTKRIACTGLTLSRKIVFSFTFSRSLCSSAALCGFGSGLKLQIPQGRGWCCCIPACTAAAWKICSDCQSRWNLTRQNEDFSKS